MLWTAKSATAAAFAAECWPVARRKRDERHGIVEIGSCGGRICDRLLTPGARATARGWGIARRGSRTGQILSAGEWHQAARRAAFTRGRNAMG